MGGIDARERDSVAADGGSDKKRACFDAVGDDRVVERREIAGIATDDVDDVGAGAYVAAIFAVLRAGGIIP